MNPTALPVLGGILRRVLHDEHFNYWHLRNGRLVLDGGINLDRDEIRVMFEVMNEED